MRALTFIALALAFAAPLAPATGAGVAPSQLPGWPTYERFCLACHGAAGDGRGPAAPFTWSRPRAFVGSYKWRSTPIGQPPTRDDLRTTILHGAPGTSMPGFAISAAEVDRVMDVLAAFDPSLAGPAKPIALAAPTTTRNAKRGAELWERYGCRTCHGSAGTPPPASAAYDLAARVLRRPHASDDADARRRAAAMSIATGLAGTPMPSYAGTLGDADLWALADHVVALGAAAGSDRRELDAAAIAADRNAPLPTGTWPGLDPDDARVFGAPLAAQGAPPVELAPAQASLRSRQCARCHAKQAREWRGSVHAAAAVWGLPARDLDHAGSGDTCARCHTPLVEQQPGASLDRELRDEGVTCAACHVRDWVRHGPPARAASLLPAPGYPLRTLALYERSDFCLPCHQLPPRTAVNGKPLLDTYREWLEGPYFARGIQCQHCHMPNREHTWLGVHDRDTFRQGIRVDAGAHRTDGAVTVVATLANVGAGHNLPTTATPAVWLRIELFDAAGRPIAGARDELRIGRTIEYGQSWRELADTRIPPGEHVTMARAWRAGRTAEAATARITVEVHPDAYYETLYRSRLAAQLPADTRAAYETALARATSAHYVAEQRDVRIARSF